MIDNISWLAIYPEIVLLTMACVIALVDLGVHSPRRTSTYVLTMLTLAVVAALLMRGHMRIDHQYLQTGASGIVSGCGTHGTAANNDEIVFHFFLSALMV